MRDKVFNFFITGRERPTYLLPTIEINWDWEYIIIGWLLFGVEIHYDLIGRKK